MERKKTTIVGSQMPPLPGGNKPCSQSPAKHDVQLWHWEKVSFRSSSKGGVGSIDRSMDRHHTANVQKSTGRYVLRISLASQ